MALSGWTLLKLAMLEQEYWNTWQKSCLGQNNPQTQQQVRTTMHSSCSWEDKQVKQQIHGHGPMVISFRSNNHSLFIGKLWPAPKVQIVNYSKILKDIPKSIYSFSFFVDCIFTFFFLDITNFKIISWKLGTSLTSVLFFSVWRQHYWQPVGFDSCSLCLQPWVSKFFFNFFVHLL